MRPAKDFTWLKVALALSEQSTCLRRRVGCVLIDVRGEVDGTGWNGVAHGEKHCNEMQLVGEDFREISPGVMRPVIRASANTGPYPDNLYEPARMVESYPFACPGAKAPSGQSLDSCEAVHAEQNALLQCTDKWSIGTCYCTASPCMTCTKLLLNTSCRRIVYIEEYPHPAARDLWVAAGREWVKRDAPG